MSTNRKAMTQIQDQTRVILSVPVTSATVMQQACEFAISQNLAFIELRLDALTGDHAFVPSLMASFPDLKFLLTCRTRAEGGQSNADFATRFQLLQEARGESHAMVDIEWRDMEDASQRQIVLNTFQAGDLVLSHHILDDSGSRDERASRIHSLIHDMRRQVPNAIPKVAYATSTVDATWTALDVMKQHEPGTTVIAMGSTGTWTRVLGAKFMAFGSYGPETLQRSTAPGQISACDLDRTYGLSSIGPATRVYGVVGQPVGHSLSPLLHNFWFAAAGIDAVYVPIEVGHEAGTLFQFLDECESRPWLHLCGLSVTIPHKRDALAWAGDGADRHAVSIGAANTLVIGDGRRYATNTDCYASVDAICMALSCDKTDLAGCSVDVLGYGGAARGLCTGLRDIGCKIRLYGRDRSRSVELATLLNQDGQFVEVRSWSQRHQRDGRIVVNTTPVGMWPAVDESPLEPDGVDGAELVFDMIYRPFETKLLRAVRETGIKTTNGLDMFLLQAAAQFVLWTGVEPDLDSGRKELMRVLTEDELSENG
ncbi:MAG: type I 3-dehydroquinate dehydratase [Phycisphaerae bacterium]